jgi:threonine dehydrogenase-like Zn-dependent dehydrogenase
LKAVRWHGERDVRVEEVPEPTLLASDDAILRVTSTAICGTDLHPYRGRVPEFRPGTILGHEFVGIVTQVGGAVRRFRPGQRALVSDVIVDGECWYCRREWYWQCVNRTMFGWGPLLGEDVAGGQAEYARIPHADRCLMEVPEVLEDDAVLFVGDILATAYVGALNGQILPGSTVAVVGCGPVGLLAVQCAQLFGPAQVVAVDSVSSRLEGAQGRGALPVRLATDTPETVRELTEGRGADVVIECAGGEQGLKLALELVRRRGTISAVGAQFEDSFPWPSAVAFDNEYTLRFGAGDPLSHGERLIELIRHGKLDPARIISHRLLLEEAPKGYELFDSREATKVVLTVS